MSPDHQGVFQLSDAGQTKSELLDLPLSRILVNPDFQPRLGGLDADHVRLLQECPGSWPALIVVGAGRPQLVDGFHRLAAAQNLGLEKVSVEVVEMPQDGDLRALAFSLNRSHGRPLSLSDRRAEAERTLTSRPEVSNMEIARKTGLSPTTIAALRSRLEKAAAIPQTDQRVSRSGVAFTPTGPGRQRGELPQSEETFTDRLFTSKERREQRRLAHYFSRLATSLEDGDELTWETGEDAAVACRLVLGDEEAAELGERLGPMARNVLDVAVALGYAESEA